MGVLAQLLPLVRKPRHDQDQTVLGAALLAFLDFGIKRTSMVEVARRGGVSLATLYRRFSSKSNLIEAVGLAQTREFIEGVDAAVQKQIDRNGSAEDQIVELYVAFLAGLRGNQLLDRLLTTEPETILPYLTTRGAPVIELGRDYVAEFIVRLQDEGKLPAYDPLPVAELIARTAVSMALTPETVIPLDNDAATREFAREHVAVSFRVGSAAK